MIPGENEALELHRKYGSNQYIVQHCQTVTRVTAILAEALPGNIDFHRNAAIAGAMLHDIGRSRTQTVQHGYVGAEILRSEGVDAEVVEIVRRHVGAGISPEESRSLGFPPGDYIPRTLEEKFVCFSDKMVSGEIVRPFGEEVERFIRKGHDVARLKRLKDDVAGAIEKDPEKVVLDRVGEHGQ